MKCRPVILAAIVAAAPGLGSATGPTYRMSPYSSATAELYDAATGVWRPTAGPLAEARAWHAAIALPSGQVLVAGGDGRGGAATTAELYEPASGTWSTTASPALHAGALVLLASGRVLATGRTASGQGGAQVFDPAAGTWSGVELWPVAGAVATRLAGGLVVVDGVAAYAESAGGWRATAPVPLASGSMLIALAPLHDGTALALASDGTASVYDPATDSWRPTAPVVNWTTNASPLLLGRDLIVLGDGKVLASVGARSYAPINSFPNDSYCGELYDPLAGIWVVVPGCAAGGALALLASGGVLSSGGGTDTWLVASARRLDPAARAWASTGAMVQARTAHTATLLPDGSVLAAGGRQTLLIADPASVVVDPGERVSFVAHGGATYSSAPRYAWSLARNESGGAVDAVTGAYVAGCGGDAAATDSVVVHDEVSTTATATVTVRAAPFAVSPSSVTAAPGDAVAFTASCIEPGTTWSLATNVSGGSVDRATGAYVAGATCTGNGSDVVTAISRSGRTAVATVTIPCGAAPAPRSGGCATGMDGAPAVLAAVLAAVGLRWRKRKAAGVTERTPTP